MEKPSLAKILSKAGFLAHPEAPDCGDLSAEFRGVQLKIGQALACAGQPPSWIGIVQEGSIRQTLKKNDQYLTIRKHESGSVVCLNEVIRGSSLYDFHAADKCIMQIISSNKCLEWIEQGYINHKILETVTTGEILEVLLNSPAWQAMPSTDLLETAEELERVGMLEILKIRNGPRSIDSKNEEYEARDSVDLISSSNVIDRPIGSVIEANQEIRPRGLLPARLVRMPRHQWDETLAAAQKKRNETETQVDALRAKGEITSTKNSSKQNVLPDIEEATSSALRDWYGDDINDQVIPVEIARDPDNSADSAIAILRMVSRYFGIPYKRDTIEQSITRRTEENKNARMSIYSFASLLDLLDVKCEYVSLHSDDIARLPTPSLVLDQKQSPLLVWRASSRGLWYSDISLGKQHSELVAARERFGHHEFDALVLTRGANAKVNRFGLRWFIPALSRYKTTLILVVVASFFVQLLALLNPLLIQQIIDAVISQGNITSLNVYGTILIFMALTEGILGSLRTFLLSDTTNRVDLALGATVIDHLMRLPLGYFAKRPVGEVSTRVNELEKIREFLTGTGLSTVLDVLFSFIYIAVMLVYSVPLTLWTLSVIPLFLALAFVFAPLIRRLIERRSESYAKVQSHLVEALSGIETVKTQSLEFQSKWRWRRLYNKQIDYGFKNVLTITTASSLSKFLDQLSGLIVIWVGAMMVLKSELTVGQLIAFRIIAGYVTSPILRLATLWQNFQETAISLERLGDVINSPSEAEVHGTQLVPIPPLKGHVRFEGISFRFDSEGPLQLANVNLEIKPGTFVGIVGGSGSGKSTLVKLISSLYRPEAGKVLVDGYDIHKVDLYSLRSQIGIVPQDSLLFDGTVQENLSLARPDASLDECVHAAKVACADEFIELLPNGYTSSVGERGSGLSGGQRQRLAIARMLITHPRLIILDEATSALDVDTERRVLRNLRQVSDGRTLIFITHRISTLKEADQIIVMHNGLVDEVGNHQELLGRNGRYAALIQQQYAEGLV